MNQYFGQKDSYSCGPVAILNALIWHGQKVRYNDIKKISAIIGCVPVIGTQSGTRMQKYLKDQGVRVKKIVKPTKKQIDDHLRAGGSIILRYVRKEMDDGLLLGHYAFFDKKEGNTYSGANITPRTKYETISVQKMNHFLKVYEEVHLRTWLPWVWLIYTSD